MEAPTTKVCTKCGVEKPLDEFSPNKGGKFGVRSTCRMCVREYGKAYMGKKAETAVRGADCLDHSACAARGPNLCLRCAYYKKADKIAAGMERFWGSAENREAASARLRDRWGDPDFASIASLNLAVINEDPERRAELNAKVSAKHRQDPTYGDRIAAGLEAYHERRRENEAYDVFMARIEAEDADLDPES